MKGAKSFEISRHLVMEAYQRVKANRGAAGIDEVTIARFEEDLKGNLYKIWNRMSSGCYMPLPVKWVEIPKPDGGKRPLGIPVVADRVAQMVVVLTIEPFIEPYFHEDSYAYRKNKSAHQALEKAKHHCHTKDWVIDLDISKFFDSIDHELLMKALQKHIDCKWALMYIRRWLTVPYEKSDGTTITRDKGVPQGSVVGPVLANLFLHYAIDKWMSKHHASIPFERYADDMICHCSSQKQAAFIKRSIQVRLAECKLELNEQKTKIVYCKDSNRKEQQEVIQFDFLGHTFRPRSVKSRSGDYFTGFNPAISNAAKKRINTKMREWKPAYWVANKLEEIAQQINPVLQGWINYYGKFYPSALKDLLQGVNVHLSNWARRKFKRFRHRKTQSFLWLGALAKENPMLFAHWKWGVKPTAK